MVKCYLTWGWIFNNKNHSDLHYYPWPMAHNTEGTKYKGLRELKVAMSQI